MSVLPFINNMTYQELDLLSIEVSKLLKKSLELQKILESQYISDDMKEALNGLMKLTIKAFIEAEKFAGVTYD